MEIRQLHAFHSVAKLHSFTIAAKMLGYTQSSITIQIKLLEEELGTKLFVRSGRQVTLTSDGQYFLHYAEQLLQISTEARHAFCKDAQPRGLITIGAGESLCLIRLSNLLKEYCKRYVQIELVLKTGSSSELKYWLKTNVIDIAFILDQESTHPDLEVKKLMNEPTVLISEPNHPLALNKSIKPENLNNEILILSDKGCGYRTCVENLIINAGISPSSILECSSIAVMKQFVKSSMGIAFLPLFTVTSELATGQLIELKWDGPDFDMSTQIAYNKNKWLSPAILAFLELTGIFL